MTFGNRFLGFGVLTPPNLPHSIGYTVISGCSRGAGVPEIALKSINRPWEVSLKGS